MVFSTLQPGPSETIQAKMYRRLLTFKSRLGTAAAGDRCVTQACCIELYERKSYNTGFCSASKTVERRILKYTPIEVQTCVGAYGSACPYR